MSYIKSGLIGGFAGITIGFLWNLQEANYWVGIFTGLVVIAAAFFVAGKSINK
jgi:hypothetical protein